MRYFIRLLSLLFLLPTVSRGQEVTVDNADPEFSILSGSWGPSANAGFYGTNSLIIFAGGAQEGRVRWSPQLPKAGIYQVDAWWVAAGNRAQDAVYEIVGNTGNTPITVNQTTGGAQWNDLGEFAFQGDGSDYVDLTDNITTGDYVSADAVRFTFVRDLPEALCPVSPTEIFTASGGGCGGCGGNILPGSIDPLPPHGMKWSIHSDLPEKFLTEGVLYATIPELPEDNSGNPLPQSVRQQVNNGFTSIDDDFEVFLFHISQPGDGSAPRRIVTWVENNGSEPVEITPRQVIVTKGVIENVHEMESTLGRRVFEEDWDTPISSFILQPESGAAVAYSNGFSGFGAGIDANINCFGLIRTEVQKNNPNDPEPSLDVYAVAIPFTSENLINSTTPSYLSFSALEDEGSIDLTIPPAGCQLSRATGTFQSFRWKSDENILLNAASLPISGYQFQMATSQVQAVACSELAQTQDLILHPGYAPNDTVGNYMIEYRVDLRIANPDASNVRLIDLTFGKSGADIGLVYQVMEGSEMPDDATLSSQSVSTLWAGPNQSSLTKSLLQNGLIRINPCEEKIVSLRFMVLGNSSLPFQLNVLPAGTEPLIFTDMMVIR